MALPKNVRIYKPKDTEEWLEYKKHSIGGSEIAAIAGLNQWTSPRDIWFIKTGQKEFDAPSLPMLRGKFFEQALVSIWEHETGHKVVKSSAKDILYIDKEYPFLSVTPDRRFWHKEGGKRTLEAKTTFSRHEEPMDSWIIQTQWELGFTGDEYGELVWEYPDARTVFKHIEIKFEPELFQKLKDFAIDWWNTYIIGGVMPEPINTNDIINQFPKEEEGKSVECSNSLALTYTEMKQIQEKIKDLTSDLEKKKFEIQRFMEDAETVTYLGEKIFSWKANKNGSRIFRIN